MNKYDLTGEYGIGYTSNTNEPFYFDLEDYDLIKQYTWRARHDKRRNTSNYYIETSCTTSELGKNGRHKQKRQHLHHLVMGINDVICEKAPIIDHKNKVTFDCRKENLRISDHRGNNINKLPQTSNTSGVIGVNYNKANNVWIARICDEKNHRIVLAQVRSKEEAIIARLKAEKKYYGEYAPQRHLFKEYGI